jgi:hypothetical protein
MAEISRFWPTGTSGDGTPLLSDDDWLNLLRDLGVRDPANQCVLHKRGNELAVTNTADGFSVNTGSGLVYGYYYRNTSPVSKSLPTAVAGNTGHLIYLEANWSTKQVRIGFKSSADGNAATPTATRTAGSVWQVPLASAIRATSGAVTITDLRQFCKFGTTVDDDMIGSRTIDETQASATPTGTLSQLLAWLSKQITAIKQQLATGSIELRNTSAAPFIDFSNGTSEDFDVRLQLYNGNALNVIAPTGGLVVNETHVALMIGGSDRIIVEPTRPANPKVGDIRIW